MQTDRTLLDISSQYGIALTGGIACGKSTLAALLRQRSYLVLDADQLSRTIVAPGSEGLAAVLAHFGPDLALDGGLDRAKMRQIVFNDAQRRAELEAIIHPRLEAATIRALHAAGILDQAQLWFYEASLIFERGRAGDFREVWAAYCPRDVQIERLMKRDHCDYAQALSILNSQLPAAEKAQRADRVIDTDCTLQTLEERLAAVLLAVAQAHPTLSSKS